MTNTKRQTGTILAYRHPTARVRVERMARHPLYEKAYRVSKSYLVHVPEGVVPEVGSVVEIEETRPISRWKSWRVIRVVSIGEGQAPLRPPERARRGHV